MTSASDDMRRASRPKPRIAIVGAGPSGTALACFLAQANVPCVVYAGDAPADKLVVGESLVPAAMPIIRRLGIEDDVAAVSRKKLGAALRHGNGNRVDIPFQRPWSATPGYAYNIPRPGFDRLVRARAEALGVQFVPNKASLERCSPDSERDLRLSEQSLAEAGLAPEEHPAMLVDATGRRRLFSQLLDVPAIKGTRNGVAHFAHYRNFDADSRLEGQIVISVLNHGWSWQIPMKDTLSVGVVINKKVIKSYGETAEERLERVIDSNELLAGEGSRRQRVSDVNTYANYQLMTTKGYGKGWVMVGDAFGFVDPMLSPGVFMALKAAELLADKALAKENYSPAAFTAYSEELKSWHKSWDALIELFYNGQVMSLAEVRRSLQQSRTLSMGKLIEPFVTRALVAMVSGANTRSKFNFGLLNHTFRHALKEPEIVTKHAVRHS